MTAEELVTERGKATGRIERMVMMYRQTEGVEGVTLEIDRDSEGQYFVRYRLHDITGTTYGEMNPITKEEAQEARRLWLTPWHITGVDDKN